MIECLHLVVDACQLSSDVCELVVINRDLRIGKYFRLIGGVELKVRLLLGGHLVLKSHVDQGVIGKLLLLGLLVLLVLLSSFRSRCKHLCSILLLII